MCGCLKLVTTKFGSYNKKPTLPKSETDMIGKQVIISGGRHGRIVETIINNSGKCIGYIINREGGKNFSVLKSDIVQII